MRRIPFFLFLLIPLSLFAQNLLMNGGFEDENICLEYEKNCAPEGWISTSLYADYYFDDEPNARQGRHFAGLPFASAGRPTQRNFLRTRLLCGLRKGARYRLSVAIRSRHGRLDSVGVYFSERDLLYEKDRIRLATPRLLAGADNHSTDWQQLTLEFQAGGGEQYLNIGDFARSGHTPRQTAPDLNRLYYFFLDDISLLPLDPNERRCDDWETAQAAEYSFNPRHDKLQRLVYYYSKNPPAASPLSPTVVQQVDTLVMPDLLFATGSYALNRTAHALLDSFAAQAGRAQIDSLVVEGHTDNVGSPAANQRLSDARAAAVSAYLQPRLRTAVAARGFASTRPVADNRTPAGRQQNRRVVVYLYRRQ